jgi:hypothetical protein
VVAVSAWTVEQYGGGLCVEQATREGNIALHFEIGGGLCVEQAAGGEYSFAF